jgi:hypothetical protein
MNIEEYLQNPWDSKSIHPIYKDSILNMRPAPEYASGEVLLASLYRKTGYSGIVSEGNVPRFGKKFTKSLNKAERTELEDRTGLDVNTFKGLVYVSLSSPKQPNQSSRRFLQLCPLIPNTAIYSQSARQSSNSWNPGDLISRIIEFGENDKVCVEDLWSELFQALSVSDDDDVWARFLSQEFQKWISPEDNIFWKPQETIEFSRIISDWDQGVPLIPAAQFVADLKHTLSLKTRLTRRQWISLIESIIRLGSASHVLWQCRVGRTFSSAIDNVLDNGVIASEDDLRRNFSVGEPFWSYGKPIGPAIKSSAQDYVMSRLNINLTLWHLDNISELPTSLSTITEMAAFLKKLHENKNIFPLDQYKENLLTAIEENPRSVAGKDGIGSNIAEFLRHVLGQRQTAESGMDTYDQGYFLRKKGSYNASPWIVSMGPVSVLTLVHCCTHLARGPRTVEDFCNHVERYGIKIRAQDVPSSDLGQSLRNLGLVLDSPDAEGGMVLVSPFKTQINNETR